MEFGMTSSIEVLKGRLETQFPFSFHNSSAIHKAFGLFIPDPYVHSFSIKVCTMKNINYQS
jgi:hypothetical protein